MVEEKMQEEEIENDLEDKKPFPKELMRRRWSVKEIVNVIFEDIGRNGKLRQRIQEIIRGDKK